MDEPAEAQALEPDILEPDVLEPEAPQPPVAVQVPAEPGAALPADWLDLVALEEIERRLLWLATAVIDHGAASGAPDAARTAPSDMAAAASTVSLMTVLWFDALRSADRVAVTPAAGAVLHAVAYLLGRADRAGLTTWRHPEGLRPAAGRAGGHGLLDFSSGRGAPGLAGTVWAAQVRRQAHDLVDLTDVVTDGRHVAVATLEDLDDAGVWEAVLDPGTARLGEILWIVSVCHGGDTATPDATADRYARYFEAAGWQVDSVRHGRRLGDVLRRPGGQVLRRRLDGMDERERRDLLQLKGPELRRRLPGHDPSGVGITRLLDGLGDADILAAMADLGGHDLPTLVDAYDEVDATRPTVLFVHTVDGWRPAANGATTPPRTPLRPLAAALGVDPGDPWARLPDGGRGAALCARVSERLERKPVELTPPPVLPADLGRTWSGRLSTRMVVAEVWRELTALQPGAVTVHGSGGRLAGLLGEFGSTWSRFGRPLLPLGTINADATGPVLPPWAAGVAEGGQSVLVVAGPGTDMPGVVTFHPASAQDAEWCLLAALGRLGRPGGEASIVRVSARAVEQEILAPAGGAEGARLRDQVLAGAYRLRDGGPRTAVTLVGSGGVMPELVSAADELAAGLGRPISIICLTAPDLIFRALQARRGLADGDPWILDAVFPADRRSPLVTVADADAAALSFVAGVHGDPVSAVGPADGNAPDAATVVGAALDLLDELE